MFRPPRVLIPAMVIVVASCTTTLEGGLGDNWPCVDPPQSELELPSPIALTLEPNPVNAGTEALLTVSAEGLPADAVGGAGVSWECWNGSEWTATSHQVVRGWNGDPLTLPIQPGTITTVPAVGLPIPNSYPILIPEEPPGIYRIKDSVGVPGGGQIVGFVIVDVR